MPSMGASSGPTSLQSSPHQSGTALGHVTPCNARLLGLQLLGSGRGRRHVCCARSYAQHGCILQFHLISQQTSTSAIKWCKEHHASWRPIAKLITGAVRGSTHEAPAKHMCTSVNKA